MQPQQAQQNAGAFLPPTISDPTITTAPLVRHLANRLVVLIPTPGTFQANAPAMEPGKFADKIQFDAFILDGGPLSYGDRINDGTPPSHQIATPCKVQAMISQHPMIVRPLREALQVGSAVVGRIIKLPPQKTGQSGSWAIQKLGQSPGDQAARASAQALVNAAYSGQWISPEPVRLAPLGVPPVPAATFVPPAPVAPAAQPTPVPPMAAAVVGASEPAAPAGYEAIWGQLTAEQRQQILSSLPTATPAGAPNPF
jgi:hypothetical protein